MRNLSRFCGRSLGIFLTLAMLTVAVSSAPKRGPQSVAPVAEDLIEAVVNISTSQAIKGPQGIPLPNVPKGSPFEDLFEDFFDNNRGGRIVPERKVSSLGSGFVIDDKEGVIVTNNPSSCSGRSRSNEPSVALLKNRPNTD